jgi:dienelactone hydrolase
LSPIDGVLLAGLLAAAAWRLAWPGRWRPAGPWVCLALAVLALAQALWLGFTWQFVGGYALLFALVLPWSAERRSLQLSGAVGLAGLMLAAIGPWAILPAPDLPLPRGPYPVGSTVYRWVDNGRPELATPDAADRRNVIAQAWYPAAAARGRKVAYMDGLGRLPGPVYGLQRFIFRRFGGTDTHAVADAPASTARERWPLVIFSPGYGAPRAVYAGLLADLASRGYVVIALDHPYESAIVQLADGRVVGPALFRARGETGVPHMERQVVVRAADVRFVLDRLDRGEGLRPLAGRLDLKRIAAIGHSFGGATAVLTASHDSRIRAAADIDGMLYGDVRGAALPGPLLLLESGATQQMPRYVRATRAVMAEVPAGGWRFAIGGSNHLSFTDTERFLSPPARWVAARVMHGPRGAADTQAVTVDILDAFLRGPLRGESGDVAAAAARARDVRGGRER